MVLYTLEEGVNCQMIWNNIIISCLVTPITLRLVLLALINFMSTILKGCSPIVMSK